MPDSLSDILKEPRRQKKPFVAFRPPGEKSLNVLVQADGLAHKVRDFGESGFVFAPFDPAIRPILLIPEKVYRIPSPDQTIPAALPVNVSVKMSETEKQDYLRLVRKAKEEIASGRCRKIVVSRKARVEMEVSPLPTFLTMLGCYPEAFCYWWHHPDTGSWMGASPELLLRVDGETFETMSLAGTMAYTGTQNPDWGEKERVEQELVTQYILETLGDKTASLVATTPRSVRAGGLLHLQSKINGLMGKTGLEDLLAALHPTPAICGLPRAAALEFIKRNEGYGRRFYGGYLGELNLAETTESAGGRQARFYVNLRCMALAKNHSELFVGGGVTSASDALAEWQETQDKTRTMGVILHNSQQ